MAVTTGPDDTSKRNARGCRRPRNTIRSIAGNRGLSAMEAMIDRILDLTIAARG
jgi:hypothetical protein